jgi:hypothetical protein
MGLRRMDAPTAKAPHARKNSRRLNIRELMSDFHFRS